MRLQQISDFMDKMVREGRTPGCSVVVYRHGEKCFRYTVGVRDLETGQALSGEENYFLFSCTKPMTAVAGLQLLERGAFLLSDPVHAYIPEYKNMYIQTADGRKKAENAITVGQLFDMTAGLHYNIACPTLQRMRQEEGSEMETVSVIRALAAEPLQFEPGSDWAYSLCHDVLAGLVSVITGKPFREYVQENILDPLGMTRTTFHATAEMLENMPTLYQFISEGEAMETDIVRAQMRPADAAEKGFFRTANKAVPHIFGPAYDSGGAGLTSTVEDYGKFAAALSLGGVGINGARILAPETVALMHRNRLTTMQRRKLFQPHLAPYGYGLGVRTLMEPERDGALAPLGEFGWGGAAGSTICADTTTETAFFFAQHTLSPREPWYQPRIRNVVYGALGE